MKAFMSWSGGKDSALSLYKAQQQSIAIKTLVTTLNTSANRISMHGVRRELLQQQAASLQLPLQTIELPQMPDMLTYEAAIHQMHQQLKQDGFTHGVFGDIFLEDLKKYREELLAQDDLQCFFPIWKMDSKEVMRAFIDAGFKAVVVCINSMHLDKSFCGRLLDESFVNDLPSTVNCCGENGEFHSFVYDGPNFLRPVNFKRGEVVLKEYASPKTNDCFTQPQPSYGFYFCDLLAG